MGNQVPSQSPPDEDLLVRVGDRDKQAFELFYDRFERRAFSLAYRIVGERSLAEDIVQDGFLSVWKNAGRYDPSRGSAGAWALGIIRNRAIDVLRSRASRTPDLDHDDDLTLENRVSDLNTEGQAIQRETGREVRTRLAQLPENQSKVIGLAFFGGFSQTEISDLLELPLGTVKGRMRLGMEKLRGELGSYEGETT
ncbi:MAG: sigma-70 family RNA polymerase sigma factor [Solirubrobacterales bacterium]|nr:sigma-70 family RNA polymerase sigma factor [Solirubrobacterales bacterium]MCB0859861.1 sigma-70 family RNA polymerase sigma factor [Solirubrobacterales bacterium]MCB0862819.1 sigma-70 family RNA polymerase sigma factor [Solirubrobacterales bacterium]HRV59421.1 sigma-70 family RNA polymerase sigma factor [Solirubrobacterales bacterium]